MSFDSVHDSHTCEGLTFGTERVKAVGGTVSWGVVAVTVLLFPDVFRARSTA